MKATYPQLHQMEGVEQQQQLSYEYFGLQYTLTP